MLLGRLVSPQTSLFREFARTHLRPLYQKFYRRVYNAVSLSLSEQTWRGGTLRLPISPLAWRGRDLCDLNG